MRRFIAATLIATAVHAGAQAPPLWAGLSPGPHRVGYRVVEARDTVAHVWYPAAPGEKPLTVRAYLGAAAPDLQKFLAGAGIPATTTDTLLSSPLYAGRNATPLTRTFPVVLVAQGNGHDVIDQVVLCEYLASQGFVVVTTPSPMRRTPMEREDQVGVFAARQAAELWHALEMAERLLTLDRTRIGVAGHSFGARAALLVAMQHRELRAIVSLDGGIGTATATEPFRASPGFRADGRLPPLLHFYETLDAFMAPEFTMLRSLPFATTTLVPVEGMRHAHFTTYGFVAAVFADIARVTRATPFTQRSVVKLHEQTAAFLQNHLR